MSNDLIRQRIEVLKYSIKTTTSLITKIHLEEELNELLIQLENVK